MFGLEAVRKERARTELARFTAWTKPDYQTAWHNALICRYLDRLVEGDITRLMIFCPPRHGKLVSDDTPILTPGGWRTHGDLRPGDRVYGSDGRSVEVLAVSEPDSATHAVRITSQGSIEETIYCHPNHEWTVRGGDGESWVTLETRILQELRHRHHGFFELPRTPMCGDRHFIVGINQQGSRRGRCVQVDAKDGLYLVGRRLVPTHNSELVSRRLPAYFLGRNPTSHVILSAYSADLADRMNRDVQRIMDSPAYRQLFPFVRLPEVGSRSNNHGLREKRTDSLFEIVGRRGSLRSAGIGVGITGMGFHLGIIDDPIKDWEEAHSTVIRDKVDEWYTSTFWTRQESEKDGQQARILLTMTRWHHDDLAGRLIERAEQDKDADQWTILRLPAIADYDLHDEDEREAGEPLWPERYGAGFMKSARASVGSYLFTGMYQQTPTVEGGQHFKEDWFGKRFSFMTDDRGEWVLVPDGLGGVDKFARCDCSIFATCDPAASEKQAADFTAIAVWLLTPKNDLCLVDMVRERLGVNNITPRLYEICKRWGVSFVGIENSGFQLAIIRECRRTLGMPPIRELSHENKSKLVRATPAIIKAEAGQILLMEGAEWIKRYVDELIKFTGLEDKHDDQVDVTAYAVWQLPRMGPDVELDHEIEQEHSSTRPEHQSYAEERGLWGRGTR